MEKTEMSENKVIYQKGKHHECFFFLFKTLLFCLCFSGVVYQVIQYLEFYWSYPEVIDMRIERDREAFLPAVTICNSNAFSRKKFCEDIPSFCENITKEHPICERYPNYCKGDDNLTLVKIPYADDRVDDDFLEYLKINSAFTYMEEYSTNNCWTGPLVYLNNYGIFPCFTLNSQVDDDECSTKIYLSENHDGDIDIVAYSTPVNEGDNLYPWTDSGFYLHIHSPFIRVNPVFQGTFMKRGRDYRIHFSMEEEHLLPSPYKSNCKNYISEWKKNNKTGPRSKIHCMELCHKEADCLEIIYYERDGNFQNFEYPASFCDEYSEKHVEDDNGTWIQENFDSCLSQCKPDCVKYKYPYKVQEMPLDAYTNPQEFTWMSIQLIEPEVHVLKHRPQYQDVELFSYIGGFLGLWLGISIYSLANIIEKTFILLMSCYHHLQTSKNLQIFRRRVLEKKEPSDAKSKTKLCRNCCFKNRRHVSEKEDTSDPETENVQV